MTGTVSNEIVRIFEVHTSNYLSKWNYCTNNFFSQLTLEIIEKLHVIN